MVDNEEIGNAIGTAIENPLALGVGAIGGAVIGSLVTGAVIGTIAKRKRNKSKTRSSRKGNSRIKHTKRGWKQDRKRFNKSQKWEVYYRKKKKGKIKYTKKGQPYIIQKDGKARFIKKK